MIFIFLCVMIVTTVLFGGWVMMSVINLIGRVFRSGGGPSGINSSSRTCGNPGCRTINPIHAGFCRRCGSNLTSPMNNPRRTAAMRPPRFNAANGMGNGRQMTEV